MNYTLIESFAIAGCVAGGLIFGSCAYTKLSNESPSSESTIRMLGSVGYFGSVGCVMGGVIGVVVASAVDGLYHPDENYF